ncbi:MAG: ATP-binding cassette domain-containing protein [Mariprofundus sp.]|nr:ATP-binding cassette domain-containing protein [Mariprofundus sp.]
MTSPLSQITQPKISLSHVYKSFQGRKVLDDISLDIMPGESHIVIGLSGAGKSVLIKCILGLLKPDSGTILVNGENWLELSVDQRLKRMACIGMLFQGAALFDSMPVWENIAFVLLRQGMAKAEAVERAEEMLEWVGLPGIADKKPAELSGGMKKRVGLARAICHRPEIIFYDEPLAGLDPVMSDVITKLIKRLHERMHVTSLTIAHNMKLVDAFSDQVSMLYEGKIYQQLSAAELRLSTDPLLRQFIEGRAEGPIRFSSEATDKADLNADPSQSRKSQTIFNKERV